MNKYYYFTQYDASGMFDEDIIRTLEDNNEGAEGDDLKRLLEFVPEVDDKFNKCLYDVMMNEGLRSDNVAVIANAWECLASGEIADALTILGVDCDDILASCDIAPFDADTLQEIADDDLKANGINANALYWYDRIDSNCIHVFNAYGNGFYYYNSIDDVITDYFSDYIKDAFIEALKN